jgi:hypothetical protein
MRKLGLSAGVIALALALTAGAAGAASVTFSFDSTEGSFGGEGTLLELAETTTPPDLVGRTCTVTLDAMNNESVHEGSDVVIASGGASVELRDVEAQPGDLGPKVLGTLVVGATVTASIRFGPDGVFSARADVVLDCPEPTPPTPPTQPTPPSPPGPPSGAVAAVTAVTPAATVVVAPPRLTG